MNESDPPNPDHKGWANCVPEMDFDQVRQAVDEFFQQDFQKMKFGFNGSAIGLVIQSMIPVANDLMSKFDTLVKEQEEIRSDIVSNSNMKK